MGCRYWLFDLLVAVLIGPVSAADRSGLPAGSVPVAVAASAVNERVAADRPAKRDVLDSIIAAERRRHPVDSEWLRHVPQPPPIQPPSPERIRAAIGRGIHFLLQVQNRDGSWGSPRRTKGINIYAPVPGAHHAFRAAVTSLCLAALIESKSAEPDVNAAIERGERWLVRFLPRVRRATPDAIYNVWAHAYSIQALVRMLPRHRADRQLEGQIKELIRSQMDFLQRYESVDGGWGYYDFRIGTRKPASSSISFVNATVLLALYEAKQAGIEPPERIVKRALAATLRQRKPDCSYFYGEYLHWRPMRGINRPGGSLGRSQACNLALRLWGDPDISDEVIEAWLNRLFARNGWLSIGRKRPIPHESWFQVAGYFYYFGHYYAARCIELLPPQRQGRFRAYMAHTLLPLQEKDGSWWDFPFYDYHQQYGTAFALMSLYRSLPLQEPK